MRKMPAMRRTGLRLRITALVVAYMLALSLAVIYHGNVVNERAEKLVRSEEHTSEIPSLMRISYAVFCVKKKNVNKFINLARRRDNNTAEKRKDTTKYMTATYNNNNN